VALSTSDGEPPKAYSKGDIANHLAGGISNALFVGLNIVWLVRHGGEAPTTALALAFGTAAGLFYADFVTGLLHWAFDTWFGESNTFVRRMVLMVREHHYAPQAMFKYPWHHDAGILSWLALLLSAPIALPVTLRAGPASFGGVASVTACVVMSVCVVFMLEFHKYGHSRPCRGFLGLLQRCHLLLGPRHHGRHHRAAHDSHYCLINGWANVVFDGIGFWRILERTIRWLTGATPRADDLVWMARYRPERDMSSRHEEQ
jgi:ubiquitin-conjugating enzyme E2 variant